MRVVHCIMVTISQITMFSPWKRMDSMPHPSGISFVNSTTASDSGSLWIMTYELTASECGPGCYYGKGSGKGQLVIQ